MSINGAASPEAAYFITLYITFIFMISRAIISNSSSTITGLFTLCVLIAFFATTQITFAQQAGGSTSAELQAQIAALMAQISALQGGGGSSNVSQTNTHRISLEPGTEISATAEGDNKTLGDFTIEFVVTAVDRAIYIKDASYRGGVRNVGIKYNVEGPKGATISSVMGSTAEFDRGVFKVEKGKTESFELSVRVEPSVSGRYRAKLDGFSYSYEPTGTKNLKYLATSPAADFRTPTISLNTTSIVSKIPKIDSFTVSQLTLMGGSPLTFNWKTSGTKSCTITDIYNGKSTLVLGKLNTLGTLTYQVPKTYSNGTLIPYQLTCLDTKGKVVQATASVRLDNSSGQATVATITTGPLPTVTGKISGRFKTLSFSIATLDNRNVYHSGDLTNNKGLWSHTVAKKLNNGTYQVVLIRRWNLT